MRLVISLNECSSILNNFRLGRSIQNQLFNQNEIPINEREVIQWKESLLMRIVAKLGRSIHCFIHKEIILERDKHGNWLKDWEPVEK